MDKIPFDAYDFFGYLATGLLVVVGAQFTLGFPRIVGQELKLVDSALLLVGAYIFGQLIATPAKAVLEDIIVGRVLGRPSINLFRQRKPLFRSSLFPGFYKPLPESIAKQIIEKVKRESGEPLTGEALFLKVRYSRDVLEDERLVERLNNFLIKYGFARNVSFTFMLAGIVSFLKIQYLGRADLLLNYSLASIATGVMLFYRYLKFFRQYSYEMFNVYGGKKES